MERRLVQYFEVAKKAWMALHGKDRLVGRVDERRVMQSRVEKPCLCCHCSSGSSIDCVIGCNYIFRNVIHGIPGHIDEVEFLFHLCRHAFGERCQFLVHILLEGRSPPQAHLLNLSVGETCQ